MERIILAIGANLPGIFKTPRETCGAALFELEKNGVKIVERSSWYRSAPVPVSNQPWFINAVVAVQTHLKSGDLLDLLLFTEERLGRTRSSTNQPRVVDLDLIAYKNQVGTLKTPSGNHLTIPHPRLHQRKFVLLPIFDIASDWCHPVSQTTITELINKLSEKQVIKKVNDSNGFCGSEFFI